MSGRGGPDLRIGVNLQRKAKCCWTSDYDNGMVGGVNILDLRFRILDCREGPHHGVQRLVRLGFGSKNGSRLSVAPADKEDLETCETTKRTGLIWIENRSVCG
jgi:hypothetical protein